MTRRAASIARGVVTYGFYPASLLACVWVTLRLLDAGVEPGTAVAINGIAFAVLCGVVEVLVPETPEWKLDGGELRADVLHMVLTNTIPAALFRTLFFSVVVAASEHASRFLGGSLWPNAWPLLGQLAFALVAAEIASYSIHRFLHESRFFRWHSVHHSSSRMYFMLVGRKHPFQAFFTYGGRLSVLWFLGIPPDVFALYAVFTATNGYVQHSNIRMRSGVLNWILATPELHWAHHEKEPADSNANYGDVLIFLDLLLGTRRMPPDLAKLYAGVGLPDGTRVEQTYLGHLRLPFRWPARD